MAHVAPVHESGRGARSRWGGANFAAGSRTVLVRAVAVLVRVVARLVRVVCGPSTTGWGRGLAVAAAAWVVGVVVRVVYGRTI